MASPNGVIERRPPALVTFAGIAAPVQENGHHIRMSSFSGQMQGRFLRNKRRASGIKMGRRPHNSMGIGIRSARQEQLRGFHMIGLSRDMERRVAIRIQDVRMQTLVQKQRDHFRVAGSSRPMQSGSLILVADIYRYARRQQNWKHCCSSCARGCMQR